MGVGVRCQLGGISQSVPLNCGIGETVPRLDSVEIRKRKGNLMGELG